MNYIETLENALGKTAKKEFLPLQPGDVPDTYADVNALVDQFYYKPSGRTTGELKCDVIYLTENKH